MQNSDSNLLMKDINHLINNIRYYLDNPERGLPEELFRFVTELTPMVNVDLLVSDKKGNYLLAWRKDEFHDGWHIPGGIVRVREKLTHRIEQVALTELLCKVEYDPNPINIFESIHPVKIRSHFISFLYRCYTPLDYSIDKQPWCQEENGYLAWHDHFPENMIPAHAVYRSFFN